MVISFIKQVQGRLFDLRVPILNIFLRRHSFLAYGQKHSPPNGEGGEVSTATDCISRGSIIGTSSLYTHTNFLDRWECNLAAVWGQMSTESGQLEETMSVVGVPVMSKKSFIQTERDIGEVWKKELLESMAKVEGKRNSWQRKGENSIKVFQPLQL